HSAQTDYSPLFDGERAYDHLVAQCDFGPRPPGSQNLTNCREYVVDELEALGWIVTLQTFTYLNTQCANIIASWSSQDPIHFVLGAHYDTRPYADQESDSFNRTLPVLGANDAGSGVGVLLELARVLPESSRPKAELVFFDAEDSGNIAGWNWIVGSTHYVAQLTESQRTNITGMILLDMVGDANLVIPKESSSTDNLQDDIWDIAEDLGHSEVFVDRTGSSVLDDHRPFLDAGIPAVDLIHTPFPWTWHTLHDTPENCAPSSLQVVGEVVETFLVTNSGSYTVDTSLDIIIVVLVLVPAVMTLAYLFYRQK
ncbi:MAG: M28 family peptidase, partial [Candidatus Thorarchaeota archaeon]